MDGTVRLKPVSTLRAVTVAPGSAAPLESAIVPTMVAVVTWALAADASDSRIAATRRAAIDVLFFMTDPPVEDKREILSKNPIYLGSAVFISDLVDAQETVV